MPAPIGTLRARYRVLALCAALVCPFVADAGDWTRVWTDPAGPAQLLVQTTTRAVAAPLVLVVAACEAERAEQTYWAEVVGAWGFAAARLDAVGLEPSCGPVETYDTVDATSPPLTLAVDAALAHVRKLPHVVADRIAVVGFSRSGIMQVFAERQERPWRDRPTAGIAFAPDCRYPLNARFSTPTLTLAGGQDADEERFCSVLMRRSSLGRAPIVRRVYPNADADFTRRVLASAPQQPDNVENQVALFAAREAVRDFLDHYLRPEIQAGHAQAGHTLSHSAAPPRSDTRISSTAERDTHIPRAAGSSAAAQSDTHIASASERDTHIPPAAGAGTTDQSDTLSRQSTQALERTDTSEGPNQVTASRATHSNAGPHDSQSRLPPTLAPASLQAPANGPPGRTLLDHLLEDGADIPFPFSALVARLAANAGPGYFDRAAVKQTAIPLGRSLQRDANREDFFGSPRIVVAVDTEPADPRRHVNMKDRLFLGYQPAAGVIEAISWSPGAGRFEFQIIDGYKAGAIPRLRAANRELCVSCHHNHAPLFALAPWSETDANPRIAARLQARNGIVGRVRLNTIVEHIDAATDRASMMAQAHEVWRRACPARTAAGRRCRAAWVTAMLQYRLTGDGAFERAGRGYTRDLKAQLAQRWRELWPNGVAVASADLRDHDPLIMPYLGFVPPHVDPIGERRAATHWNAPDDATVATLVRALAGLLDTRLVNEIDAFISATAGFRPGEAVELSCEVKTRPALAPLERIGAFCASANNESEIELDFVMRGDKVLEGVAHRVRFGGARFRPALVLGGRVEQRAAMTSKVAAGQRTQTLPVARLVMKQRGSGLHIRLPRGDSVRIAELIMPSGDGPGRLRLLASDDFAAVAATVARLAAVGSPALASPAFRPAMLLNELFDALQIGAGPRVPSTTSTASAATKLPNSASEPSIVPTGLALLRRTCGSCHAQATVSPPGFLYGDEAAVARQIQACAPRMWRRLNAWLEPESKRTATPMPPPHVVTLRGHTLSHWPNSLTYRRLTRYVSTLLSPVGSEPTAPAADHEQSCVRAIAALRE